MSKKAKVFGKEVSFKSVDFKLPDDLSSKFEMVKCIEVSSTRSQNKPLDVVFEENDLLALQFTDNTEWIGHPDDIQEIYDQKTVHKRAKANVDYLFENQITSTENSRGDVKNAVLKFFSIIKTKKLAKTTVKELVKKYDHKVQPNPGLFLLDATFTKKPFVKSKSNTNPYLLLIHGTLSTTTDAFSDLKNSDTWSTIVNQYGANILALEHFTLSESPLNNLLHFLQDCPTTCTLDILSHSRGGLVADLLAKCDYRNDVVGFSENELSIVSGDTKREDLTSLNLMKKINRLASNKRIKIGKVIRVASPSSGTTILSRRVDHFFNLLLNAVSLAFGIRNPLYETVKSFLLEIISLKEDPELIAGLNSMMPESLFQKMLNSADTNVVSDLYAISGDSEVGGLNFDSLKVILANLFYRDANDLVVDTKRMNHGIRRSEGIYTYLSEGSDTNHFKYFTNKNTCQAIVQALQATNEKPATNYSKHVYTQGERGVVLDLFSLDGIQYKPETITRDVVILIPGIMGSTLSKNDNEQWVAMREINKGGIVKNLKINATSVKATGIIKKFYSKLANHLSVKYDVISLEFDWRKSVSKGAISLSKHIEKITKDHKVNIHIVAHSMGGLVARQCMMNHPSTWVKFNQNKNNKLVLLGTPWLGSYLIMEVLTGHSKRVKQLAAIDFKNDKSDLLKVFWKYPGIFELLPVTQEAGRDFAKKDFWIDLDAKSNLKHMPDPNTNLKPLSVFNDFRNSVTTFLNNLDEKDFKNIYYICGKDDETVFDYKFKNKFLSRHKKLVYLATSSGDGSVTWESGIPKQLVKSNNLYYSHTTHGDLANEEYIFKGISDIIAFGKTDNLSIHQPATRSGEEIISEIHEFAEPLLDSEKVVKAIFGTENISIPVDEAINISVINSDLRVSSYPVMVGHFFMDLILSAEKALDGYLNNRLSQRVGIGYYPGRIGESEVFFNLKTQPKGAIICGLGTSETLTPFLLSKTVKLAILKYAMFMRDNYTLPEAKKYASGISIILMGIGYGKLPIEDSLRGILLGVSAANKYIKETDEGLKLIKDVELVNYYESIASQAYLSLCNLNDSDSRIKFNLKKGVIRRSGAKKKQLFNSNTYDWWKNIQIKSIIEEELNQKQKETISGFKYYSTTGLARVEQEVVNIGMHKINHLLDYLSDSSQWNKRLSKTLFEILIPNQFKDLFRNQNNVILKIDKEAAAIPWELLHDDSIDDTPAAVNSAFIRQLVTEDYNNYKQVGLNNINALVVGDPIYKSSNLPQLSAAKAEAEWVASQLSQQEYKISSQIRENSSSIMMELFSKQYKIMHFSGHGLYDPDKKEVGIAIGDGICIDPAMINQVGVPEFVFINCCYSGVIDSEDDKYSKNRHKLAANVGTQLIEMGVKAIIISGWAVDDAAAKTFAETFYQKMFEGYYFGMAVQKARMECYQNHQGTNTWGAYHCYGNQFYKFNNRKNRKKNKLDYIIPSQAYIDLDNLLIGIRDQKQNPEVTIQKLQTYLERAEKADLLDAVILEKEAIIYSELGDSETALIKFKELFKYANGNFSIEALEQYCIIKSHQFTLKTIHDDLKEIELLTLVGENPSRLNIVGNAHKLAAMQFKNKKEIIIHLTKAFAYYKTSFEASLDKFDGQYLDAMSNLIFIGHILELYGEEKLMKRLKSCKEFENEEDINAYLAAFLETLEKQDKSNLDVSVLLGIAETSYGLMLLKSNFKPNFEVDIIRTFQYIFQLLYSPRFIQIELVQIDFMLHFIKDTSIRKQLNKIKVEIKKILH